jgi:chromate transporter
VIARVWGRIGVLGFGGPPTHIRMLRDDVVTRHRWLTPEEFEDANAACGLLPGPASTQMAIYTAWRAHGVPGAIVGGLAFILPGLIAILALAAVFLGDPPAWVIGAGLGAGSAVAAVAVHAGWGLTPSSWERRSSTVRWALYLLVAAVAAALAGPWVVIALLGCGLVETLLRAGPGPRNERGAAGPTPWLALVWTAGGIATLAPLAWTAFKVGALSYGGGFVIIPLMQADAVDVHHWMTHAELLNAVALGQVTPGPVTHTVAVVGYAAAGLAGALLASLIAFGPSFLMVVGGGRHFTALRANLRVRAFLDGAGPAAIGAIYGAAVPLARPLDRKSTRLNSSHNPASRMPSSA